MSDKYETELTHAEYLAHFPWHKRVVHVVIRDFLYHGLWERYIEPVPDNVRSTGRILKRFFRGY